MFNIKGVHEAAARRSLVIVWAIAWVCMAATDVSGQVVATIDGPVTGQHVGQPFAISGWAIDLASSVNSGIDAVHVYAAGPIGSGVFLGAAAREARPDVAQAYQRPHVATDAGYRFTVQGLPGGSYTLGIFAHSSVTGGWAGPYTVAVTVHDAPMVVIDPVTTGAQPFLLSGLAGDRQSQGSHGIDAVHVWAYPTSGTPIFVGAAETNLYRPDALSYGPQFANSGWRIVVRGLAPRPVSDRGVCA